MTAPLLIAMPGNEQQAAGLAAALGFDLGHLETRQFPDGETYLRFITNPEGRSTALFCTLDHPRADRVNWCSLSLTGIIQNRRSLCRHRRKGDTRQLGPRRS